MEENLIVYLGVLGIGDYRDNINLIKCIKKKIISGKTFGELLDYMLDPREDSLNPAYNREERELANRIVAWKDMARERYGLFSVGYLDSKNNPQSKREGGSCFFNEIKLEEKISSYLNKMIKNKKIKTMYGRKISHKGIDLVVGFSPIST